MVEEIKLLGKAGEKGIFFKSRNQDVPKENRRRKVRFIERGRLG